MRSRPNSGNINLRGKRWKLLSCRCCEVRDLRPKYAAILAAKEIRAARIDRAAADEGERHG